LTAMWFYMMMSSLCNYHHSLPHSCPDNCGAILSSLAALSPSTQNIPEVVFLPTCPAGQPPAPLPLQLLLLRLDMREKFFTMRVVRPWHRLPSGRCPIPGKIQGQAGRGSEQPIQLKMSLLTAVGLV